MNITIQGIPLTIPDELFYAFEPFASPLGGISVNGEGNEMQAFLRFTRDKNCLVDVGALFGVFSAVFSKATGKRAFAIEPSGPAIQQIEKITRDNSVSIDVFVAACGASRGTLTMRRDEGHDHVVADPAGSIEMTLTTVDTVAATILEKDGLAADALKIDTEGYELEVLRGAERTLEHNRPAIFLEVHVQSKYGNPTFHGYDVGDLESLLARHRYRVGNLFGLELKQLAHYLAVSPFDHHRLVALPVEAPLP